MMLPFFTWMQDCAFSVFVRNSVWIFAMDQVVHLLALAVFAGAVLVVDLRLMGTGMKDRSIAQVARDAQPYRSSPERLRDYMLARFRTMSFNATQLTAMTDYLRSTNWTGADAQLQQRVPGLARLIVGSGEYQFN